jgi:hypothetical protein
MTRATLAELAVLTTLGATTAAVLYVPGLFRLIAGL